ncbi:heme ABC transporter ATP-binding protein [Rubrobacter taiwanensis]|uniref:Heme ABC transporter ATP-binding protein n=1 Tax=Rubrobacter taiwanensis TaxID=185139 RepID=A0A4R1BQH5_9ACTN|nr:heme ABC transporter ATP-binding protein [Rubrobacter taiwanensis]TCJ19993.1 heme ABC transporter ATP-binding protein [Rubrobacter taiwanensis]
MRYAALQARDLGYSAGASRLLGGVELELYPGELLALVGPNGAGKTTLLRLLAGDAEPAEGEVLLYGRPLSDYAVRELALKRSVLPQQTYLRFAFTALEVVLMGRAPHLGFGRDEGPEDLAVARRCMEQTDTRHLEARSYPTLSGGEQRRVTLARVLAQEAPVMLLDEPTAALDIRHQELVMETARGLAAGGAAVLAVLHDLNLAAAHADRVAVLSGGELVALGRPAEVMTADLLSGVFDYPISVTEHPARGTPLILPLPRTGPAEERTGMRNADRHPD